MDLLLIKDISVLANAVGVGNCFLLSYSFLVEKQQSRSGTGSILSFLFFILGMVILNTIFNFTGYSDLFSGFERYSNVLSFAIAPLLYLYLRSLQGASANFSSVHLWHFYIFLGLGTLASFWASTSLGKFAILILESKQMIPIWNLHFFVYLIFIVKQFRKAEKGYAPFTKILVLGVASIWFLNFLFYVYGQVLEPLPILFYLNITLLFTGMTLWMFYRKFRSQDFQTAPRVNKNGKSKSLPKISAGPIVEIIRTRKYYSNPELSIRQLSEKLEIPYHELSAMINTTYGQNFNEFINSFRIAEVVSELESGGLRSYTIMGLAQKAGFRSASAFYAAFKKEMGTTPRAYAKSIA